MEQVSIALLFGIVIGAVLMFFMKDRVVAADNTIHAKLDQLRAEVVSVGQQVANHVTQQVGTLIPKPPAPPQ